MARAGNSKATVRSLQRDLERYAKQDKLDHARLSLAVDGVKGDVAAMQGQITSMGVALSGACGQLTVISSMLKEQQDIRATARKDKLDAKEADRQDNLSSKDFRRKLILKVASIAAIAGGGVIHLMHVFL